MLYAPQHHSNRVYNAVRKYFEDLSIVMKQHSIDVCRACFHYFFRQDNRACLGIEKRCIVTLFAGRNKTSIWIRDIVLPQTFYAITSVVTEKLSSSKKLGKLFHRLHTVSKMCIARVNPYIPRINDDFRVLSSLICRHIFSEALHIAL